MVDHKESEDMSMDEVLASIRKIIASDAPVYKKKSIAHGKKSQGRSPIELTQLVDEDGAIKDINTSAQDTLSRPSQDREVVPPHPPKGEDFSPKQEKAPVTIVSPPSQGDSFLSERAVQASLDALSPLRDLKEPTIPTSSVNVNQSQDVDTTLRALVLEALRPKLNQWIDRHLPQIIRQIVQEEVQSVIRKSGTHS